MKYRLLYVASLCLTVISFSASGLNAQQFVSVVIGGKPVALTPNPRVYNGSVYVPLSAMDLLGAKARVESQRGRDSQRVEIVTADRKRFTQDGLVIDGHLMLPIQKMAEKLEAVSDWDEKNKTLTLRARIVKIEFDGSRLKVATSYPVRYDTLEDSKWKPPNKIVLDLYGVYMPSNPSDLNIQNKTSIALRTGSRDEDQTGRIVIDMPEPVKCTVDSPQPAMEISLVATRDPKSQISNPRSSDAPSLPPAPTRVVDIGYHIQDSSRVEVYVNADGVLRYSTSISRNPYRLSVSLLNAVLSKDFPGIQVRHSLLQRVSATQIGCDVILTMELTRVASYKIRQEGGSAKLVVGIELPKGADGRLAGKIVVIDPGHGGSDGKPPGCFGLLEKNCTLDIAKRVQKVLAKAGLKVVMTREADVNVDLAERALIAKRCAADFFISIHCNAAGTQTGTANGTETYYHGGDPSGQALAECVHPEVVKAMGLRDRSVKPDTTIWQTGFGVLRMTSAYGIPAILIEVGFLDNPVDAERIADPGVQEEVARAILNGLKAYVAGDFIVPVVDSQISSETNDSSAKPVPEHPAEQIEPARTSGVTQIIPLANIKPHDDETSSGPRRPGQRR